LGQEVTYPADVRVGHLLEPLKDAHRLNQGPTGLRHETATGVTVLLLALALPGLLLVVFEQRFVFLGWEVVLLALAEGGRCPCLDEACALGDQSLELGQRGVAATQPQRERGQQEVVGTRFLP
jgi:hypothetical protein